MLREYSNYLAPQPGLLSADTWTMVAIWARNTGLNLLILGLFLMGALMMPRLAGWAMALKFSVDYRGFFATVLFWSSAILIGLNLDQFRRGAQYRSASSRRPG